MNKRNSTLSDREAAFLRLPDVQKRYNVGRITARKLADDADAVVKVGRCVLVDVARLDAHLEHLRTGAEER